MTDALISDAPAEYVGVRFHKLGKLYHFKLGALKGEIALQDYVIVETRRGRQLGQVLQFVEPDEAARRSGIRPILRKATPPDLLLQQTWQSRQLEALITCREKAAQLGIRDARFIQAEYSFDGSWLTIAYTTDNKKLNLSTLSANLGRTLKTRIEMQLVGPRDQARILGGYGACGGPRCCSTFLTEFSPVSIRMAKAQGISLSPNEITGMCGRLRCCLVYEYEQYVEARKTLPKVNKRIRTPHGDGVVKDVRVLRDSVLVEVNGEYHEVFRQDLEPLEELQALQDKAEAGCAKRDGGGCDCGARHAAPPAADEDDAADDSDANDDEATYLAN